MSLSLKEHPPFSLRVRLVRELRGEGRGGKGRDFNGGEWRRGEIF